MSPWMRSLRALVTPSSLPSCVRMLNVLNPDTGQVVAPEP